jgi:hypothetical protein
MLAASDPVGDAGILQQVFSFLPGNWLFLDAVCKEWQAVYTGLADQQIYKVSLRGNDKLVSCGAKTTLYSAAVASPATARLACEHGVNAENSHVQLSAGFHADLRTLLTLRELGMPFSHIVVSAAARSGRLTILQYLLAEQQCPKPCELTYFAARSGNVAMLNWLWAGSWYEPGDDKLACAGAARAGNLALLQLLHTGGCDWDSEDTARDAASSGSLETVKWLRQQQGIEINAGVMAAAARMGQIAMCEHLRSIGCEWGTSACEDAAIYGEINMLRWLRQNGCPWTVRTVCMHAAYNGCTEILDYVVEQGEVLDAELLTEALNCAGSHNNLPAAQWLRQRGAQWPADLYYYQYESCHCHGDTLAWARAEGCRAPLYIDDGSGSDMMNSLVALTLQTSLGDYLNAFHVA